MFCIFHLINQITRFFIDNRHIAPIFFRFSISCKFAIIKKAYNIVTNIFSNTIF